MTDKFLDLNGEIRLSGTLVAPGGLLPAGGTTGQVLTKASNAAGDADWETGGGYTPPTGRAFYSGNNVSIADNAFGFLTWDTEDSGSSLLDLTTPSTPAVVTAGIYAVSVKVDGLSLTVGGFFYYSLELDAAGDDAQAGSAASPISSAVDGSPAGELGLTYYIPAGGTLKVQVTSRDGVAARNFRLNNAVIQRLT